MVEPFFISAPGKVILFGEHSAVYGKPAIAAALSLRAYLLVTPNPNVDVVRLDFPDINLSYEWNRNELPFDQVESYIQRVNGEPKATDELVPEIVDKLAAVLNIENSLHYTACLSFLYLYLHFCTRDTPGMIFCVRSTVPIGAGLGSSACTSVCLASAVAYLGGHLLKPLFGKQDKITNTDAKELDLIDKWSLIAEKTFHGNPSGIDNAVATHGGAVMFQRMTNPSQPSIRTTMRNLPPLKLLLTNSKIPRSTASLVSNVGKTNGEYPNIVGPILDAMGNVCSTAYQLMIRPVFDEECKAKLKDLASLNHGLLVALGVSHPSLEEIKMIADRENIGVTKLTGAGGGGCAITLVNEDIEEDKIQQVILTYKEKGFECYETSLGGKGVGALFLCDSEDDKFSLEKFSGFSSQEEIETCLHGEDWKFW